MSVTVWNAHSMGDGKVSENVRFWRVSRLFGVILCFIVLLGFSERSYASLTKLPKSVLGFVLGYLDRDSIDQVSLTAQELRTLTRDPVVYSEIFKGSAERFHTISSYGQFLELKSRGRFRKDVVLTIQSTEELLQFLEDSYIQTQTRSLVLTEWVPIAQVDQKFLISVFEKFEKLDSVYLHSISNDSLKNFSPALARIKNLVKIELSASQLDATGLSCLAGALFHTPSLRSLAFTGSPMESESAENMNALRAFFESLSWLTQLVHLDLEGLELGDARAQLVATLLPHLPHLQSLSLRGNLLGEEGMTLLFSNLGLCKKLKFLDLGANRLGKRGIDAGVYADHFNFPDLPGLKTLYLDRNRLRHTDLGFLIRSHFPSLEKLSLKKNLLGRKSASPLSELRKQMPVLEDLDLSGN